MFLLSKFFPKLLSRRSNDNEKMPCIGEKPKDYVCKVLLLDDSELTVSVKSTAKGQVVLTKVFEHLNIIEREYFGLRYLDSTSQTYWLDPTKGIGVQLKNAQQHMLYFGVKFYAADPCKLHEEITRYQFFQQVKRDILTGRLPVNFDLAAELGAFIVQSEVGDYDPKRHSYGYVSEFRLVPNQTEELEMRIMDLHKQVAGQVPAVTEYKFLDKVKWLDKYGVDLHPVQGEGSVEFFVGLTPTGIIVIRNKASRVDNSYYFWPRITKITFKGKMFLIRVKDKNNDENTHAFECCTKQACKHLWKCCVEHHAFFSGRTERQALADAMNRPQPQVVRTPSRRQDRRLSLEGKPGFPSISTSGNVEGPVTTIAPPELVKTPSSQRKPYATADSPRSTRSAPWESHNHRKGGLYTSGRDSPMSTRSDKMMFPKHSRHSGSESENGTRRGHGERKRESDNESEASVRRHRRRRERGGHQSEGEIESNNRKHSRHSRRSAENLTYTEDKWKDIQRRIRDGTYGTPYDSLGRDLKPNGRSRSPGNKRPPEELAQHFRYVEPEPGMTSEQLRDIPYTKVETAAEAPRVKHSPHQRHRDRHRSPGRRRSYGEDSHASHKSGVQIPKEEPPPPYSGPLYNGAPYPERQNYEPQLQYNDDYRNQAEVEELVRPPVSVYRNETHTAPIVKTKPVAMYTGGGHQYPYTHMQHPAHVQHPQSLQHSQGLHGVNHARNDSGLGIDQPDMSHQDRHFKRSSAFEPLMGGGQNAGYHSNLTNFHDTRSLTSLKSDPYRFYYTIDRSRAPSSHSLASSGSHFSSHQGARPAPSYKVISKPMYVEQVSSEPGQPSGTPSVGINSPPNMMAPPPPSAFTPTGPNKVMRPPPANQHQHMAMTPNKNRNLMTEL